MYLFLLTFITLYGGLHFYVYLRLHDIFHPARALKLFLIFWMVLMTVIPLPVHTLENSGLPGAARLIAWPGYLWMGFVFILATDLLITDAARYLCRYVSHLMSRQIPGCISARNSGLAALVIALSTSAYAIIEAGYIRSEHVVISTSKLPQTVTGFRVVQISDVHTGLLLQKQRLKNILDKVSKARPDILVSTGDLLDGKLNHHFSTSDRDSMAGLLASVKAPFGKFAVIGNHEVYAGLPRALDFTRAAGFTILRNKSLTLSNGVVISGVDDRAVNPEELEDPRPETALIRSVQPDIYHILLKHRPEILPDSTGCPDLQLSGHVHGGQIFPFNLIVRLKNPLPCGLSTVTAGSQIYVSRGTGTWGPPMRLFAPPEITIIDIVPFR